MTFVETVYPAVCIYLAALLVAACCRIGGPREDTWRAALSKVTYTLFWTMVSGVALSYFVSFAVGQTTDVANAGKSSTFFMLCGLPVTIMSILDSKEESGGSWLQRHYLVGFILLGSVLTCFALGVYSALALSDSAGLFATLAVLVIICWLLFIALLSPAFLKSSRPSNGRRR